MRDMPSDTREPNRSGARNRTKQQNIELEIEMQLSEHNFGIKMKDLRLYSRVHVLHAASQRIHRCYKRQCKLNSPIRTHHNQSGYASLVWYHLPWDRGRCRRCHTHTLHIPRALTVRNKPIFYWYFSHYSLVLYFVWFVRVVLVASKGMTVARL